MEPIIKKTDPRPICFAVSCFYHDGEKHCDCQLQYTNERGICGAYRDGKQTEEIFIRFENFNGIKVLDKYRFIEKQKQEEE